MIVVRTLGTAEIQIGETRILPTSPRKFALLLYLAIERGRSIPRATLQELIFPDQTEKNGAHSLRELVYQLRRVGAAFISDAVGIAIAHDHVRVDLDGWDDDKKLTTEQIALFEGGFLPGYEVEQSETFREWLAATRARVAIALSRLLVNGARRARTVADWSNAERAARACLGFDPLNEEAILLLAEALAIGGSKAQAIRLLDAFISEVGESSRSLSLPASVLRRRIGERPVMYTTQPRLPFVGRETEMRLLDDCLRLVRGHHSHAAVIIGDAGVGKTRLAHAFSELAGFDGVRTVTATTQPHDIHRPFGVFADLLESLKSLPGALGTAPESLRRLDWLMTSRTEQNDAAAESLRSTEPALHSLTHAVIDLVDAISTEAPLLLLAEDLHCRDEMSRRILGYLASAQRRRRLLIVVTTRDPAGVDLFPKEAMTQIVLSGLPDSDMEEMIAAFSEHSGCTIDAPMSEWLRTACAGNPLFLESLLAHFAATGERFRLSPTLSGVLKGRISGLSERALIVLQMCSTLGRHATLDFLGESTELKQHDLTRGVHELETARLLRATDQLLLPAHALVAETVRELATPTEIQLLHRHAAVTLERHLDEDDATAMYWECAEHWLASGSTRQALRAVQRCANHATKIGRYDAVAVLLSRALRLPMGASERSEIARQLVIAADACANSALVFEGIAAMRADGPPQHDDIEFAEFRAHTRQYRFVRGGEQRLLRCVRDSMATADHRIAAAIQLLKFGDTGLDRHLSAMVVSALPDDVVAAGSRLPRLEYSMIRATFLGDLESAAVIARELVVAADSASPLERIKLTINATVALCHSGHTTEALLLAERAWADATSLGTVSFSLMISTFLGDQNLEIGNRQASLRWLEIGDRLMDEYPTLVFEFAATIARLGIAMGDEDVDRAQALFDRLERAQAFQGGVLRLRWSRVSAIRIRQIKGDYSISDDDLAELVRGAQDGAILGGICDLEAGTAVLALWGNGRNSDARHLLTRYLNVERRSRATYSVGLSAAIRRVFGEIPPVQFVPDQRKPDDGLVSIEINDSSGLSYRE